MTNPAGAQPKLDLDPALLDRIQRREAVHKAIDHAADRAEGVANKVACEAIAASSVGAYAASAVAIEALVPTSLTPYAHVSAAGSASTAAMKAQDVAQAGIHGSSVVSAEASKRVAHSSLG